MCTLNENGGFNSKKVTKFAKIKLTPSKITPHLVMREEDDRKTTLPYTLSSHFVCCGTMISFKRKYTRVLGLPLVAKIRMYTRCTCTTYTCICTLDHKDVHVPIRDSLCMV